MFAKSLINTFTCAHSFSGRMRIWHQPQCQNDADLFVSQEEKQKCHKIIGVLKEILGNIEQQAVDEHKDRLSDETL